MAMSMSLARGIVDEIAEYPNVKVHIDGGEPFLHPHLDEIVGLVRARGLHTSLVSGGAEITPARLGRLAPNLNAVHFSLDSSMQARHDVYRGHSGLFQNVMNCIDVCVANGTEVKVWCVVSNVNIGECMGLIPLLAERGVHTLGFWLCTLVGRAAVNRDMLAVRPDAWRAFVRRLEAVGKSARVGMRILWPMAHANGEPRPQDSALRLCESRAVCHIAPDGHAYACPFCVGRMGTALGTLVKRRLLALWMDDCAWKRVMDASKVGAISGERPYPCSVVAEHCGADGLAYLPEYWPVCPFAHNTAIGGRRLEAERDRPQGGVQ